MLLPSRKTQRPAHTFRSQDRLGWNLALPEEDRTNRRQMDGPILRARNFREGECSRRAEKLSCQLMRSARNIGSGGTSPSRKKTVPAPFSDLCSAPRLPLFNSLQYGHRGCDLSDLIALAANGFAKQKCDEFAGCQQPDDSQTNLENW